jgi:hypothetical protein
MFMRAIKAAIYLKALQNINIFAENLRISFMDGLERPVGENCIVNAAECQASNSWDATLTLHRVKACTQYATSILNAVGESLILVLAIQ